MLHPARNNSAKSFVISLVRVTESTCIFKSLKFQSVLLSVPFRTASSADYTFNSHVRPPDSPPIIGRKRPHDRNPLQSGRQVHLSVPGARGFSGTGGQELNLMNDIYLIAGVGEDVFDSVLVS